MLTVMWFIFFMYKLHSMLCIDHLYMYDSQKDGMGPTLITWGDGLSCERHVDAQNARNNELIP